MWSTFTRQHRENYFEDTVTWKMHLITRVNGLSTWAYFLEVIYLQEKLHVTYNARKKTCAMSK
jgi:hypothetical protein